MLDAQGGVTVGDYTQIGLGVMVWSHTSHRQAVLSQTSLTRENITYRPTKIGNGCFIGGPSVIAPGVNIGDRVIVSPLTFVDRDVPDDAVIGGNREARRLQGRIEQLEETITSLLTMLSSAQHLPADEVQNLLAQLRPLRQ